MNEEVIIYCSKNEMGVIVVSGLLKDSLGV